MKNSFFVEIKGVVDAVGANEDKKKPGVKYPWYQVRQARDNEKTRLVEISGEGVKPGDVIHRILEVQVWEWGTKFVDRGPVAGLKAAAGIKL